MTSVVDTSVKHFYSAMAGAPTVSGTAGSLIATLDACLVHGFGVKVVDSATVSNGVCRLSFASGVSAATQETMILVSGASPAALNGEQKVTAVASGRVEFKTNLPDGVVTDSISFKLAPLGWEKVFSKTNVAVYRSADITGTRAYYRVDDTNALFARVQMYESMTDVDTGVAVSPQSPAGGYYWHKRSAAAGTGVYWVLLGDSRGFYLCVAPNASSAQGGSNGYGLYTHYAGDLNSYRSGDAWSAILTGAPTATYSDTSGCVFTTMAATGLTVMRMSGGIGVAIQVSRSVWGSGVSGNDSAHGPFPSRADNGLRLSEILLSDGSMSSFGPRGELPGVYHCTQTGLYGVMGSNLLLSEGQGVFTGRSVASLGCGQLSGTAVGCGFFDVTGPWRK